RAKVNPSTHITFSAFSLLFQACNKKTTKMHNSRELHLGPAIGLIFHINPGEGGAFRSLAIFVRYG
ncbi:hypothetical protein ACSTLC_24155, partial [Vibrio parahaemolyticus]